MPASSSAIRCSSASLAGATRRESAPPICCAATRAWSSVCAAIRSWTASACVRSSRPERNARCVNSPGAARRTLGVRERARQDRFEHDGRAVRCYLDEVVAGVAVRSEEGGDDGVVEGGIGVLRIDDPRKAGARVLQRGSQHKQLRRDLQSPRPGEPHDTDSAPARRRGDGGDGVGRKGVFSHTERRQKQRKQTTEPAKALSHSVDRRSGLGGAC